MNKTKRIIEPDYLEQSKSMICGILLDVTYFINNNKQISSDEIQKYIKIIIFTR